MKNKILPLPCTGEKYKSWEAHQYLGKMCEELGETTRAFYMLEDVITGMDKTKDEDKTAEIYGEVLEEATDVITAATSFLEAIGADVETRQRVQGYVNLKNITRDNGARIKPEYVEAYKKERDKNV